MVQPRNSKTSNRKEGAGLRGLTWEDSGVGKERVRRILQLTLRSLGGGATGPVRAATREGRTRWAPTSMQTPQPGHPVGALELRWASLCSQTGSQRDTILPQNLMPPAYSPWARI